jgi:hypothetical protein
MTPTTPWTSSKTVPPPISGYCGPKTLFGKVVVRAKGGVRIDETAIFDAVEWG